MKDNSEGSTVVSISWLFTVNDLADQICMNYQQQNYFTKHHEINSTVAELLLLFSFHFSTVNGDVCFNFKIMKKWLEECSLSG